MRKNGSRLLIAALCLAASSGQLGAVDLTCEDPRIQVTAQNADLAEKICRTVADERDALGKCGLSQSNPLSVIVDPEPPFPGLLGHFRPRQRAIHIIDTDRLDAVLDSDSIYRLISLETLLDSIVVHEVAHAFFYGTTCGQEACLTIHEYIASVMQIQSLPADARQVLVEAADVSSTLELEDFTLDFLQRSPENFAVSAWAHFSKPDNGCSYVRDLLAGKIAMPSEFE